MMRHIFLRCLLCCSLIWASANCKGKEGEVGPKGKSGESTGFATGKAVGFVQTFTENGNIETDYSGVTVTAWFSDPTITAVTNSLGRYEFTNLPTGNYDLIFSKMGYNNTKIIGVAIVGGEIATGLPNISLHRVTSLSASTLNVTQNGAFITLSGTFSGNYASGMFRNMRTYISSSNILNRSEYMTTLSSTPTFTVGSNLFTFNLATVASLYSLFPSGTTVYFVTHPATSNSSYMDASTGRIIYPFISASAPPVASFVMP